MRLHQLKRSKGLKNKQIRRGRGNATGTGNYSGRGLKGQKARSGSRTRAFFEGGQTSIVQRLPKAKGFKRYFKFVKEYVVINLGRLEKDNRISDNMEINKEILKKLGYMKKVDMLVKILGDGAYSKHLSFVGIDVFSKSAKEKMENPGIKKDTKIQKVSKERIVKEIIPDNKTENVGEKKVSKAVKEKVVKEKKVSTIAKARKDVKKLPKKLTK